MSFLEIRDLTKRYGDVLALADFDLHVERGEFISLLGPSGCGKTTTLQALAGFVQASKGSVLLEGRDITHVPAEQRHLGVVFQSYALFPHMTVARNVAFGLEMRGVSASDCDQRVARMLDLVHLSEYAARYPRELSGGQKQRVAVARALVIEPPLLLLDEPLSNLDAKLREAMQFELRRIQRKLGTTTLMVTHDQSEALSISDRVVVMDSGRIQQIDTPHRIYEHPKNGFVASFVGKTNLLRGHWRDGALALPGDVRIKMAGDYAQGQPLSVVLRPEKISITVAGEGQLPGRVLERFFLGSQWLYRVSCALGEIEVTSANDGRTAWEEDAPIGLAWPVDAARAVDERP